MPKVKASLSENKRLDEMQKIANLEEESQEQPSNQMKISNLKDLILLGRISKSFSISGFTFEVTTLSALEQSSLMRDLMKYDDIDRVLKSKAVAISYCLKKINSVPLSELSEGNEGDSEEERKVSFVLDMQAVLIDKIFAEYEELVKQSSEDIGQDSVKK